MNKSQPPANRGQSTLNQWFRPKPATPSVDNASASKAAAGTQSAPPTSTPKSPSSYLAATANPNKRVRTNDAEPSQSKTWQSPSPSVGSPTAQLPSPSPSASIPTPTQPDQPSTSPEEPKAAEAANKSFTANTSFTSMRSSQSSRRVTVASHGNKEIVKGSDSEDDSDAELEDLNIIMNRSRPKPKPALIEKPNSATTAKPNTTRSSIGALFNRQNERAQKKNKPKRYAFDIKTLVKDKEQKTALEVRVAEAEANLNEALDEARSEELQRTPQKKMMRATLAESNDAEDGQGRARRVMEALTRTEAFEGGDTWHFFAPQSPPPYRKFPKLSHPNKTLSMLLNEPARREQAFLSGYIQRIAAFTELPDELLEWMMSEICRERRDTLLSAYIETLELAVTPGSSCLAVDSLNALFASVGGRSKVSQADANLLRQNAVKPQDRNRIAPNLSHLVDMLTRLAARLPIPAKDATMYFLLGASFDVDVLADADLCKKIQTAITYILPSYPEGPETDEAFARIIRELYTTVPTAVLRQQLVSSLPSSDFLSHLFRRRLATVFTLDKLKLLDIMPHDPVLNARFVVMFAKSSALRVHAETDYAELKARLAMFDIALDAGFSDFEFLEDKDRAGEKKFNESVDDLTNAVRELMSRIIDVGAAHMRRTAAKSTAEALAQRLEYAVRTKEKPPKDWFGQEGRRGQGQVMKNWMQDAGSKKEEEAKALALIDPKAEEAEAEAGAQPEDGPKDDLKDEEVELDVKPESKPDASPESKLNGIDTALPPISTPEKKLTIRSSNNTPSSAGARKKMVMMRF